MTPRSPAGQERVSFGELLRHHRAVAGLTQEALAEQAHLSARGVSDLERGARRTPRHDTVLLLAAALGLTGRARSEFEAAARALEPASRATAEPPPFVGRAAELVMLDRHLAGDGPPVLLLAGEPGIGKSRLLGAAQARAASHGLRVLAGGCQRRGGQEPYAPLLEALQRYIRSRQAARLRAELDGCAWLVRLLPELAAGPLDPLPAHYLPPEQERRLVFEAVARFLANVAGPGGTLLLLDDLQWAGSDALDLLARLARPAGEIPLRVLSAYRQTEVGPQEPLSVMLADLTHAGLAARRLVSPLAPEESAQLLDRLLDGWEGVAVQRERLLARAAGVPFFVVSWAQALQSGGREDEREGTVPWSIAQSVHQRLAALPTASREVLLLAAVIGRLVPHALLSAVAGAEADVPAALDAACGANLLEEVPARHAYRFTHDVIHEVLAADLGLARRTQAHRRIAQALERGVGAVAGEPVAEEVAYHYGQTEEHARAAYWLERAGDRAAAVYSLGAASEHYRAVRDRLVAAGGERERIATLEEKLGAVLIGLARYDEALTALDRAAETFRAARELEGLRRVLAQIGVVHAEVGTWVEGLLRLQPLLGDAEGQTPTPGLAALYAVLADLYERTGQRSAQLGAAERGEQVARAAGDQRLLADALEKRGFALLQLGRLAEAEQVVLEACAVAERAGELKNLGYSFEDLAYIHLARGESAMVWHYFERALEAAERRGSPFQVAEALAVQGSTAYLHGGDWRRACAAFERAVAISHQVEPHGYSVAPLMWLGYIHLAAGEREAGTRCLAEGIAAAPANWTSWAERWAGRLLAEHEVREGRSAEALGRLLPLLDRPGRPGVVGEDLPYLLPILAMAHLGVGDLTEAGAVAGRAVECSRAAGNRLALVDALRVQALVAIERAGWAEAQGLLDEGLRLARMPLCPDGDAYGEAQFLHVGAGLDGIHQYGPYPYGEARLLHAYGQLHHLRGEPGLARERLEAALIIFRRLGARLDIEQAEILLGSLG